MYIVTTGFRRAKVEVGAQGLVVYLNNETSPWDSTWPQADPPKGFLVFTLEMLRVWWGVDFWTHPFASTFASLLDQNRAALKLCLPHLTFLVAPAQVVEEDSSSLAIFKMVQLFARLTYAWQEWRLVGGKPGDSRGFILEAFKYQIGTTGSLAAKQIIHMSKYNNPTKAFDSLGINQNRQRKPVFQPKGRFLNPTNTFRGNTKKPGGFQQKPTCFKCGKVGHTQRVCRSGRRPSNKANPNPPDMK